MVYLKNDFLNIEISEKGAEIVKATNKNGEDVIWIGDKKIWGEHAPVLFPICGSVLEDKFTYNGISYDMAKHGFAKKSLFTLESSSNLSAVFLLKSSEETKKIYPFDFELRIKYTLNDKKVNVGYIIDNKTDGEMIFSIGAHEGYMCQGAVENCTVEFDSEVTVKSSKLSGPFLNRNTEPVIENSRILPLKSDSYWVYDLIFENIPFTALTLKNSKGEKIIRAEFADFPHLLIWTQKNAPYVCIEPWYGLPDFTDHDGTLENKIGTIKLKKGESRILTHSFEIF